MLVLTRRVGEVVIIQPKLEVMAREACAWFGPPVEVRVLRMEHGRVRLGILAGEGLLIARGEWGGR